MSSQNRPEVSGAWRLKSRTLEFGELPALMGIVNVTPDSFSDGGKFYTPTQAIEQALRLEDEGADILDIGGESTRPYSEPVAAEEELQRIEPVISSLVARVDVPISIDTTKAAVARAAVELGAEIVNDISGLEADSAMLPFAAEAGVGVCAMHMQGNPQNMQDNPSYDDATSEILAYLRERDRLLQAAGIATERICLDPGIGFGKSHSHNLELLSHVQQFHQLQRPLLVGHSRKGFVGKLIGDKSLARDFGTVGMSIALAKHRVQILRVHNIRATREALVCFQAAGGFRG